MPVKRKHISGEYAVTYNTRSHLSVLLQCYGSVWDDVILYCLLNVGVVILDYYILDPFFQGHNFKITDKGHSISIFLLSFLIVTRANMALDRCKQSRDNLKLMRSKARDLVTSIACQSKHDQTQDAKDWRNEIAYYTCLLLRLAMAAFSYGDDKKEPWIVDELKGEIKTKIRNGNQITGDTKLWAHERRTKTEEAYRAPNTMALHLRLLLHDQSVILKPAFSDGTMNRCNAYLDGFMGAYNDQIKMFMTPAPFPLVQMARTVMFVWVFTLPFALETDSSTVVVHCIIIFFLTFAFMGLETVSLELDDPFGHDANDFDNLGLAKLVFEDIYAVIKEVDGPDWATDLREKMKAGDEDPHASDERTALLREVVSNILGETRLLVDDLKLNDRQAMSTGGHVGLESPSV